MFGYYAERGTMQSGRRFRSLPRRCPCSARHSSAGNCVEEALATRSGDREYLRVRNDVDHLPAAQQDELACVKQILMEEFSIATSRATQPWKKNGKVQNIILFGS